jgi:hypothetical protein
MKDSNEDGANHITKNKKQEEVKIDPKSYDPSLLVIIVGPFLVSLAFCILSLYDLILQCS